MAYGLRTHYNFENAARALKMSTGALVERIKDGHAPAPTHNGVVNLFTVEQVNTYRAKLEGEHRQFEAEQEQEKEQERRQLEGAYIARELEDLQKRAAEFGYPQEDGTE